MMSVLQLIPVVYCYLNVYEYSVVIPCFSLWSLENLQGHPKHSNKNFSELSVVF